MVEDMVNPTDSLIALTQAFEQIGFCAGSAEFRAGYEIELLKRNPHMGTLRHHQAAPSQGIRDAVAKALYEHDKPNREWPCGGFTENEYYEYADIAIAAMSQPVMGDASTRKDEDASNRSEATPKSPVSPSEISGNEMTFEEWYRREGYYHDTVTDRKQLMRTAWQEGWSAGYNRNLDESPEPVSVNLRECVNAAQVEAIAVGWGNDALCKIIAKAVLDSLKAQGVQFDVRD